MELQGIACLKCGTVNQADNVVCTSCGAPLQQVSRPADTADAKAPNPAWRAYLKVIWWMNATLVLAMLIPYSEIIGVIATGIIFIYQGIWVVKYAREMNSEESIIRLALKSALYNALITFAVSLVFLLLGLPLSLLALAFAVIASIIFLAWNPIAAFIVVVLTAVIYNAMTTE